MSVIVDLETSHYGALRDQVLTILLYFLDSKAHLFHILKFMKLKCVLHLMASKNRCRKIILHC
jgi:hypothetical protein